MSKTYNKGTKLLIELLSGETYEGNYSSGDDSRITLYNVKEYPSGNHYDYQLHLYKMEFASISVIEDRKQSETATTTNNNDPETTKTTLRLPVINLADEQYENIKDVAHHYIYFAVTDSRFVEAIESIRNCDMIALFGFGSNFGRCSKINLLTVATKRQVYVFDVKLLGKRAFEMGLKDIFESDEVLKVVHDCKSLADCLEHSHNVTLTYVFDTQVADLMLLKRDQNESPNKMRKFSECVNFYLNIPTSVIEKTEISYKHIQERPLSDYIKMKASFQTTYLYNLKRFLELKLLRNFNYACNTYLQSMRNVDAVKAKQINDNSVPESLKSIDFNKM